MENSGIVETKTTNKKMKRYVIQMEIYPEVWKDASPEYSSLRHALDIMVIVSEQFPNIELRIVTLDSTN